MQRGAPGAIEAPASSADQSALRSGEQGPIVVRAPNLPPLPQPETRATDAPDPLDAEDADAASAHARDMVETGVAARDLAALQALRAQLDERAEDGLLAARDDQALDLAIACLSERPDAQQRAQAFYAEEPATALHMQVRTACLGLP
jgi:hypothetical protein